MASTSTSKAKTKNAKKTVSTKSVSKPVKSTKKTASQSKVTAKKVVAEKQAKVKKAKTPFVWTEKTLKKFHLVSALLLGGSAVAAGLLMQTTTYFQLVSSHMTQDGLLSGSFLPAAHLWASVELRWCVVAILGISAAISLLRATRLQKREHAGYSKKYSALRWVEFAVTFGLLTELSLLLTGTQDVGTLKLAVALVAVTAYLSWLTERGVAEKSHYMGTHLAALFTGFLPWVLVVMALLSTQIFGEVRLPWHGYAAISASFAGVVLYEMNKGAQVTGKVKNYLVTERNYLVIGLATKLAVAAVLVVGLLK